MNSGKKAGYFKILVEDVGYETEYLDMKVTIKDHHLSIIPKLKGSTMVTPLARDSCHPETVHSYWPSAMMDRLNRIGGGTDATKEVLSELARRFPPNTYEFESPNNIWSPNKAIISSLLLLMKLLIQ